MYLFTRRVRIRAGGLGEGMAWAMGMAELSHQVTGLDISLYSEFAGPEFGSLAFTTVVPDLLALEAATDKLSVDSGWLDAASRAQEFAPDGASDRLLQFVFPTDEVLAAMPAPATPAAYATVVTSGVRAGQTRRGMELGVEIAQKAADIGGAPTSFLVDTTGAYGGVNWITLHTDIESLQASEAALAANAEWLDFIDREVAGVYADDPAATQQLIYRRVI